MTSQPVTTVVDRLRRAVDSHDIEALVNCFAESYQNETPAHPGRGFSGRTQVRTNWEQIFAAVPDIEAEVLRTSGDGDVVWTEWEMRGTRRDGAEHLMRGVIIFGIADNQAAWARFYLEPVDAGADGIDGAIRRVVAEPADAGRAHAVEETA